MKNKIVSYKLQSYLALIPFLGVFIVWTISMINIYKSTKKVLLVFLHFLFFAISGSVFLRLASAVDELCISRLQDITLKISLSLILYYFVLLAIGFSAIGIQKSIIKRHNKKVMLQSKNPAPLFYEDLKKVKIIVIAFTVLFYIGFFFAISAIILHYWISPAWISTYPFQYYQDISVLIICAANTIYFTVVLKKAKGFKNYLVITENELECFYKGKKYTYNTADINSYGLIKKQSSTSVFKLSLSDERTLIIPTQKGDKLTAALDAIITSNIKIE